jgi:glutamine synthetase
MLTPDGIGNGTHIHFSLWDAHDRPVMHDTDGTHGLSALAEQFVAGILHHTPALAAITAPSAGSYHRLTPGRWAPTIADLGVRDRGSSLRICPVHADTPEGTACQFNVEYRVADATASPYLALGALVWAGLDGIRSHRKLSAATRAPLPATLGEAVDLLEACAPAHDWFGAQFRDVYLMFKRSELAVLEGLDARQVCDRYAEIY